MRRSFPIILCSVLCFLGCQQKKNETLSIDEIHSIHQRIDSISEDSVYPILKNLEQKYLGKPSYPDSLRAENQYLLGLHFKNKAQLDSAATYFYNAIEYIKDSVATDRQAAYFSSTYDTYAALGLYADCLTIGEKFENLLNPEVDHKAYTWAYHWQKTAYLARGKYKEASEVVNKQIEHVRKNNKEDLPYALNVLAEIKYYYLKDKKGAFETLEEVLKNEDSLTFNFKQQTHTNYGVYQYFEGDFNKALFHYLKALEAGKQNLVHPDYTNALADNYNNIGEVYIDLNQYNKARVYLDSVQNLGIQNLARDRQKALLNYELRLAIEGGSGSQKISSLMSQIYEYQDEVYEDKAEKELTALTKANEKEKVLLLEKQATEIKNIQLQNRSILLLISIALLSIIGFLFYQSRRLKFEKQSLQNQQRLLRSQMNPHFTFNTLYAIQNQIKKEPEKATNYLLKFSRLLRLFLENSMGDYIALEKEVESLKKYMDLQLLRTSNPFEYKFHYENMEEDELVFIPPMLLQPFVENSIEHGFSGIEHTGKITITLTLEDKFISCVIEDNGKGLSKKGHNGKQSASTQLISNFLKKSTKRDLEIIDKRTINPEESGLLIRFLIPFKFTEHD